MLGHLKHFLKNIPTIVLLYRSLRLYVGNAYEKEMLILPFIVDPKKIAIDVGAHTGYYTHALLKLGAPVVAVEADPKFVAILKSFYGQKIKIIAAAASSSRGTLKLRIPRGLPNESPGIGTIEAQNKLEGAIVDEIDVPLVVLDELNLAKVGFIKIDVEGHEFDVLQGAKGIIARDLPSILVEAEERHKPGSINSIIGMLTPLGYQGFMLNEGRLSPISNFEPARDQFIPADQLDNLNAGRYEGRYINNFLFIA